VSDWGVMFRKRAEKLIAITSVLMRRLYSAFVRFRLGSKGAGIIAHFPITLFRPDLISIGSGTVLREHLWLNAGRASGSLPALTIGEKCYLGRFCQINAAVSVAIEDKVLIADKVYISDVEHDFSRLDVAIIDQGVVIGKPIRLKYGCWIGTGAVIKSGVTIGRNAVVGANSVVTKDVPDFAIVAGVPARVIRERAPQS